MKHATLLEAVTSKVSPIHQRKNATADTLLSTTRELRSVEVNDLTIYFYHPQSVAEREAFAKNIRFDDSGGMTMSMMGIVDGIIARVKDQNGRPMFSKDQREKVLAMPAELLLDMWHAIGGDNAKPLQKDEVEAVEKK